nr:putative ribonuclease H-like domain-containing protein [Tanacetum cinerariifolium]
MYCLVVTDDYSRFTWVLFLATKDETSGILKSFITRIENLVDHKVKVIRCDNGTEFKNREMNQFCEMKGILRQFSLARTPQQNEVAERRNRTLIKAARTMIAYSNKAFRVFNSRTRIVEENFHIRFSESTPNVVGTQSNGFADPKSSNDDGSKPSSDDGKKVDEDPKKENGSVGTHEDNEISFDPNMPALEDVSTFDFLSNDEDNGAVADMNNLDITIQVSPIPTTRIHKDHPLDQVIGDFQLATQIRKMSKNLEEHGNKKDERGIVIRNKVRLVAQGYTQEERTDYDEVFAPVDDIIFCSTKKELCIACEKLMHEKLQMSSMGELTFFLGLQVKQKKDGTFISQDKYVAEILKKFRFTKVKTASTPMETQKPLLKDEDGKEVDVHMYRSMIGSLMYLTSSRPDIMFAVCACARYQVNLKVSHLYVVKRIFRVLYELVQLFMSLKVSAVKYN